MGANCGIDGTNLGPGKFVEVNEAMSENSSNFQNSIEGTREGYAYEVNGVKFDGFDGKNLIEAKGDYTSFVKNDEFQSWFSGQKGLTDQAIRQMEAAGDYNINWHIQDETSYKAIKKLFKENGIEGINLIDSSK